MLTIESECDVLEECDEEICHYQAFNNDPVNNVDPSGLAATRSYLAGSETTNFHSTKEVVVLPDGSRQITYRLFLSRTEIFSAGVGARGQVFRSEQEVTNAQQIFGGPQAAQTEAIVDRAVASRVDSLNQIDVANARVDNMQFGFGLVPFFSAADNYIQGKPWKLDAAISALSLALYAPHFQWPRRPPQHGRVRKLLSRVKVSPGLMHSPGCNPHVFRQKHRLRS